MARFLSLAYGLICYGLFFGVFLYFIGFLANVGVPKGIDGGTPPGTLPALAIDLALIALFGVQHSVMARRWFKTAWTRVVPRSIERSTFVLASSLVLALIYWAWQPIPLTIWKVTAPWLAGLMWGLFATGLVVILLSTFLIDHLDLFGLRQVYLRFVERPYTHPRFKVVSFYRLVRHPLYTGFILALWFTPHMTVGHLVFAAGLTAYILIAVRFEERDLVATLGERYRRYRDAVPMLVPRPGTAHETVTGDETAPSGMR